MTDRAQTPTPAIVSNAIRWARANLFNGWFNSLLTLAVFALLIWTIPPLYNWLIGDAIFAHVTPDECKQVEGACWAFVAEKYRYILFGTYPFDQHWRPGLAVGLFIAAILVTATRQFWTPRILLPLWGVTIPIVLILLFGGVFGLEFVPSRLWGGFVVTLILAVFGAAVAFPIAILLALGRRSSLPIFRVISVTYIECIRGVPLITLLFMASFMIPLFLPEGMTINNLLRAQVAIIMFVAAYLAEVIRGGLQAIPKGQYEAADALGLSYWQKTGMIILPQALKITIPPMVNTFIGMFKDTSLVLIVGIFDLLLTTRTGISDAPWRPFFAEGFVFAATIYWVCCFAMSKYSQWLEHYQNRHVRR